MARARLIERVGFDGIWIGESIGRAVTARPDVLTWLLLAAAGRSGSRSAPRSCSCLCASRRSLPNDS